KALRDVKAVHGSFYKIGNWTEDWHLTLALKHLGWKLVRPQDCMVATVPVSRIRSLFKQRERWAHGYLQTLSQFGWTKVTRTLWLKQIGLLFSIVTRILFLILFALIISKRAALIAWWQIPIMTVFLADS